MTFLIVDSSSTIRVIIQKGLETYGDFESSEFVHAASGMDAVPLIRKIPEGSLLFISSSLPDFTLPDLLKSLEGSSAINGKQLVVITEKPERLAVPSGLKLLGFLIKPFNMKTILKKMEPLISHLKTDEVMQLDDSEDVEKQKTEIFDMLCKYFLEQNHWTLEKEDQENLKKEVGAYLEFDEALPDNDLVPAMQEILEAFSTAMNQKLSTNPSMLTKILTDFRKTQHSAANKQSETVTWTEESLNAFLREGRDIRLETSPEECVQDTFQPYLDIAQSVAVRFNAAYQSDFSVGDSAWLLQKLQEDRHQVDRVLLEPVLEGVEQYIAKVCKNEASQPESEAVKNNLSILREYWKQALDTGKMDAIRKEQFLRNMFAKYQSEYRSILELLDQEKMPEFLKSNAPMQEALQKKIKQFEADYLNLFMQQYEIFMEMSFELILALIQFSANRFFQTLSWQCKRSAAGRKHIIAELRLPDLEPPTLLAAYLESAVEDYQGKYGMLLSEVRAKNSRSVAYVSHSEDDIAKVKAVVNRINPLWKFYGYTRAERFEREYMSIQPAVLFLDYHFELSDRSAFWKKIPESLPLLKAYSKVVLVQDKNHPIKKEAALLQIMDTHLKKPFDFEDMRKKLLLL